MTQALVENHFMDAKAFSFPPFSSQLQWFSVSPLSSLLLTNWGLLIFAFGSAAVTQTKAETPSRQNKDPRHVMQLEEIINDSENLPDERRQLLDAAATKIRQLRLDGPVNVLAVCTHNSRRSQLSQAWCALAVAHYRVPGFTCHSCGTEATACNPRTIEALERAGWKIVRPERTSPNPRYECAFGESKSVMLWSKAFGDPTLPRERIVALLCCSDADKACPTVPGALARVALHYADPKVSDGTAQEAATYDARSRQIAAEMFYLVRRIRD